MATILCLTRWGVVHMSAPEYDIDRTARYTELRHILAVYIMCPYDLDLWPFDPGVMSLGLPIPIPSLNWIWLTVPEFIRLQLYIDCQLKVPFFTFLGVKRGSNFKFNLSNPQKALPWPERRIMTYCVGVCPEVRPVGAMKKGKKDRNFHASNWLIGQTTHVDIAPWNFACGVMSGK